VATTISLKNAPRGSEAPGLDVPELGLDGTHHRVSKQSVARPKGVIEGERPRVAVRGAAESARGQPVIS